MGIQASTEQERDRVKCLTIWQETLPLDCEYVEPAKLYLRSRGLDCSKVPQTAVRAHPQLPYHENGEESRFPAVVSRYCSPNGQGQGLLRTYLEQDGSRADVSTPKKALGCLKGAAVHLDQATDVLALAEGLETALAVREATHYPSWATGSASGLMAVEIPESVKTVHIYADNDGNKTGQRAAHELAGRLDSEGRTVIIHTPPGPVPDGKKSLDWLDVYVQHGKAGFSDGEAFESSRANSEQHLEISSCAKGGDSEAPAGADSGAYGVKGVYGVTFAELPQLHDAALIGLPGDIVRAIEPDTEAHPFALLSQLLVYFGNVIGRGPHWFAEVTRHGTNLFLVLVGDTSRGRKGTSESHIKAIFSELEPDYVDQAIRSGLSTGEGLIYHVRDPVEKTTFEDGQAITEVVDAGVTDKRLLAVEPEFASVLKVAKREGNTLSPIIRQSWDHGNIATLTRNNPLRATSAYISIIGHITKQELCRYLDQTEMANGFGNRFLFGRVHRSKELLDGGSREAVRRRLQHLVEQLRDRIQFARNLDQPLIRDGEAGEYWKELYSLLTRPYPGMFGAMTARSEAQVMRLACLYALLDLSSIIRTQHLGAAFAFWKYCEESCRYIFGDQIGDPTADAILVALRNEPAGMTLTEIRQNVFKGNRRAERVDQAIALLMHYGLVSASHEATGGRPATRLVAIESRREES